MRFTLLLSLLTATIFALEQQVADVTPDQSRIESAAADAQQGKGGNGNRGGGGGGNRPSGGSQGRPSGGNQSRPQQPRPNNTQPRPNNTQPRPNNSSPRPSNPRPSNPAPRPSNPAPRPNNPGPPRGGNNNGPRPGNGNNGPRPNRPNNNEPWRRPDNRGPNRPNGPPRGDNRPRDWERDCRRGGCGHPDNRGRDWGSRDCRRGGCDGWRNDRGQIFRDGYWRDDRGYIWRDNGWYDNLGRVYPGPSPIIIEPYPVVIPIPIFTPRPPSQTLEQWCAALDVDTDQLPDECLDVCEATNGEPDFCYIPAVVVVEV